MFFNPKYFSNVTTRITRILSFSFTPFLLSINISDPIEQYDIGSFTIFNFLFYPVYLHFLVVVALLVFLTTRIKINALGYINFKLFNFVRDLFISVFGKEKQKLFPFFYYTFLFLLINNLLGMLPWSYTLTSQLTVACFFSITGLGGLIMLSVQQKGWRFFELFSPVAPKPLLHFLIIVEFVSFLIRFISLAVRLFANMVAGHALLKILLLFLVVISASLSAVAFVGGLIGFVAILAVFVLEVFIAFLQAYVFVFLLLIYAKELLQ